MNENDHCDANQSAMNFTVVIIHKNHRHKLQITCYNCLNLGSKNLQLCPVQGTLMLSIHCLTTLEEFAGLRESWTDLFKTSEIKSAFLSWEWLFGWWQNFGEDADLLLVTAWRDGHLAGIAPCMFTQKNKWGFKLRLLSNIAYHDTDTAGFIISEGDDETLHALCQAIRKMSKDWQVFELVEAPAFQVEKIARKKCFSTHGYIRRVEYTSHLYIPIQTKWETYFESQSKNLRHSIKQKLSRISKEGKTLDFRRYIGHEVTQEHLEEIFALNEYGSFPETYQTQKQKDFHFQLLERMRTPGYMDISFLDLDGTPIAFRYGFNTHNRYEDWRLGFDSRYSDYSPGALLMFYTTRDNFQRGLKEIDLLRGLEDYKRRWKVEEKSYCHIYTLHRKDILTSLLFIWAPGIKSHIQNFFRGVIHANH
ncbi:MAG: GNAT family N-acetyltransferase [Anaerolineaceae bacterium]|nr:GNAT family N-acetyltransferase [Anaerolineaceae bacterium]